MVMQIVYTCNIHITRHDTNNIITNSSDDYSDDNSKQDNNTNKSVI